MSESNMICPYCSAPYTKEMLDIYDGTYGCDTGCEYYNVEVTCTCGKTIYRKGDFGMIEDDGGYDEVEQDHLEAIIEAYKEKKD